MKKNKKTMNLNLLIILFVITIGILLFFLLQPKRKEITFTFNENNMDLKIGDSKKILYEINDNSVEIAWQSGNDKVASVNQDGIITANDYGMTLITGSFIYEGKTVSNTCLVNTYTGTIGITLEDIEVEEGELLMMLNSDYVMPFELVPTNSYIKSIEYLVADTNVVDIVGDKIVSKNVGNTSLTMVANENIRKTIEINVSETTKENKFIKRIKKIDMDTSDITLKVGDSKDLIYEVIPSDGYIEEVKWTTSDANVVTVQDGFIKAISSGSATITLKINSEFEKIVNVNVLVDAKDIKVEKYPKKVIRVGESTSIEASVIPSNATNKKITYKSSNPGVVSVNNGVIKGLSNGNTTVKLSIENGKTISIDITVLPQKGVINGTGNLWGYQSLNAKVPTRAGTAFFQKIAQSGRGTLQGNIYTCSIGGVNYVYYIDSSTLSVNNERVLMRIYYPENTDLSNLNTFTYMGGDGEKNFYSFFSQIDKNPSLIKSAGVSILVAEGNGTKFDQNVVIYTTQFTRYIMNQKKGTRNSIAGFSTGGTKVMFAADKYDYDRVIVFSSYFNWPYNTNNVKNKEVMFYVPSKDHLFTQAKSTLNDMKRAGYTNVTIVTNSNDLVNAFGNTFLVINPGSLMLTGHLSENVLRAGLFAYGND